MLLHNLRLYTHDLSQTYIADGAILISGNEIADLGEASELLTKYPTEEKVDMKGRLVMPGLINCHTHIYSAYARGMSNSKPTRNFMEILENLWWALDKKLTLRDCRLNAYQTMIESIKNGVTTLIDHHASPYACPGSLDELATAALDLGMRCDFCYELSDRDGKEKRDQGIAENVRFIERLKQQPEDLLRAHFGLHALFTLGDESMKLIADAVHRTGASIHCHCAEGIDDENDSVSKYGSRVIERLAHYDLLRQNDLVVHLCHVSAREMDLIADKGAIALHNPQSNMGNAVGRTPVEQLLKRGILVGLGSDAYTNDMLVSMANAKTLLSHDLADPTHGFAEAAKLLLQNNPEIASRIYGKRLGVIEKGALADLVAFDYTAFEPLNEKTIYGHLIFGFTGRMCVDSMINGKFVMRDRQILGVNEQEIAKESCARAKEIWQYFQ